MAGKIAVCLLVLFALPGVLPAQWASHLEGEIMLGPSLASVAADSVPDTYAGFGVGMSFNIHVLHYRFGSIGFTIPPVLVIGQRADASGFDFQRFHIPIGVMLTAGDAGGYGGSGVVGGAITVGYGATIGAFTKERIDARPFLQFDVSIGIFERGALKLRYRNVFGEYLFEGAPVSYHGLYVVGSSAW